MTNLLLALSWALFYILHTAVAASKLKRILKAKPPATSKWYSLFYSVLSAVLFMGIILQALFLPVQTICIPGQFGQYAGYMVTTAGVIVFVKAIKEIPLLSFFGLRKKKPEELELVSSGIYSQIRHPFFFGLLAIFLGYFLVSGTLGALIHLTCLVLYLPVGIYFEEKNLVAVFGEDYREYQQNVPPFFPKIHKKRG
ncbi:isoprenylcysteine carboxylmethyltransferase family protein [Algoriphagus sp. A40]|uniref:methyltransferase family protein n=1 Tax=Algoriphagus sp. A40 TaxID=1945863 RepID=UPI0009876A4A|nr:isoprenylcysteine carboxylmethyltransferase family protein [Algoriphagus sp. A40]OOG70437.1 hypothetical protein B0E43_17660 [Algoriphagus sp. A40]